MEKNFNFVYITTNLKNGKQYVGDHSTNKIDDKYLGSGKYLGNAISLHGPECFQREIIEYFPTKKEAFDAQEKFIKIYNTLQPNGYNISPMGGLGMSGCFSEETLAEMSKNRKGKPSPKKGIPLSEEHKANITKTHPTSLSEDHKKHIGEANKLRKYEKISEQGRLNISIGKTGLKLSEKQLEGRKHIKKIECPHCGNSFIPQHYNRSHGDKCKKNQPT